MHYVLVLFLSLFIFGCSSVKTQQIIPLDVKNLDEPKFKEIPKITIDDGKKKKEPIKIEVLKEEKKDISTKNFNNIVHDIEYYTKKLNDTNTFYGIQKEYEKHYFSMWNLKKAPQNLASVKWAFDTYRFGDSYGENLQLLQKSFFTDMYKNSNFDSFLKISKYAITTKYLNMRVFPTKRPLLRDPSQVGEGFPFDYLQNSTIEANKPIFVSHYSKDRRWVFIFSSFTSGWVEASDIAFLTKKQTQKWQMAKQLFFIKEGETILDTENNFLFKSRIGMMLPLVEESKNYYTILAVKSGVNQTPVFVKAKVSKDILSKHTFKFSKDNLNKIIKQVAKTNYGWGGIYEQRDCSSTIRDMFAPFGIWLPRNSSMQSKVGKVIDLESLSNQEKISTIKKYGKPFKTLLYKQGHIVLYVGTYNDEVVVFHNTWRVKSKDDKEKIIIGKPILSTLELGKNQPFYDEESSILNNLKSMNIIVN